MSRSRPPAPYAAVLALPVTFQVGGHTLAIAFVAEGRWTVALDGGAPSRTYPTQVEAWEAGVRAADEVDRPKAP